MSGTSDYTIFDRLLEGCEVIDFDFRYLYLNDTAVKQKQKSRDELLGRTVFDLYPNIKSTPMFFHLKQCMNERKTSEFESRRACSDGTTAWFNFTVKPVSEGVCILSMDISANKQEAHSDMDMRIWPKALEIEGWSETLCLRNRETEEHTLRVAEMTVYLARMAAISEGEITQVRLGALLHDIGKMGIPDSILLKPGRLSGNEWGIMRKHPQYAYDLIYPVEYLRPCLPIPYHHHEKWDGTGYPKGLKGEQIPLPARLFAIVDVWETLSSSRIYREAWSQDMVIKYIRQQAGLHFDPEAVELFLYALGKQMNQNEDEQIPLAW